MRKLLLFLLLIGVMAFPSIAQVEPKPTFDLTIGASQMDGDPGENPAPDSQVGANVNIPIATHWDLSIGLDRSSVGESTSGHIYNYKVPVALQGVMFDRSRRGNLRIGVGALPRISEGDEELVEIETEAGTEELMQDNDQTQFDWFLHMEGRWWFNAERDTGLFVKVARVEPFDNDLGPERRVEWSAGVTFPTP